MISTEKSNDSNGWTFLKAILIKYKFLTSNLGRRLLKMFDDENYIFQNYKYEKWSYVSAYYTLQNIRYTRICLTYAVVFN